MVTINSYGIKCGDYEAFKLRRLLVSWYNAIPWHKWQPFTPQKTVTDIPKSCSTVSQNFNFFVFIFIRSQLQYKATYCHLGYFTIRITALYILDGTGECTVYNIREAGRQLYSISEMPSKKKQKVHNELHDMEMVTMHSQNNVFYSQHEHISVMNLTLNTSVKLTNKARMYI